MSVRPAEPTEARLPAGFDRNGKWERRVWLRPWTGRDEIELFGAPQGRHLAALATALLARCVFLDGGDVPVDADFVRGLSVGDREALLLQLRGRTLGDALPCVVACPACGVKMELALRTADLLVPCYGWEGRWHEAKLDAGAMHVRVPTGGDQEAVAELVRHDPAEAARVLARRCVRIDEPAWQPSEADIDAAVRRVAELDPQAEMRIDLDCPECGRPCRTDFDTLAYLTAELRDSWHRLHQEIHLLAFHYHWSESDILAMPRLKRIAYVEHLLHALEARRAS